MEIYYAGIGARDTPQDVCRKMFTAGKVLWEAGVTLRSGGAKGADTAFESGALCAANGEKSSDAVHDLRKDDDTNWDRIEIYLPFKRFNGHPSPRYGTTKAARQIASHFHPKWEILSCTGRDFMGRNAYQILGAGLDLPVSFVLCWTPEGRITGGTGQALRHAKHLDIPILNFAVEDDDTISDFIISTAERMRA
ncbi:hypothetical protein [Roseovarius sp. 217 phage 1]|uniref:Uncharacterized protein n=1 Tax=Roseovarius sp. 217 phage 1 TaxID=874471 RepID=E3PZ90_9CAUD|nr:hypothetical protein [Roseovarius sp. 217 phage 1]